MVHTAAAAFRPQQHWAQLAIAEKKTPKNTRDRSMPSEECQYPGGHIGSSVALRVCAKPTNPTMNAANVIASKAEPQQTAQMIAITLVQVSGSCLWFPVSTSDGCTLLNFCIVVWGGWFAWYAYILEYPVDFCIF